MQRVHSFPCVRDTDETARFRSSMCPTEGERCSPESQTLQKGNQILLFFFTQPRLQDEVEELNRVFQGQESAGAQTTSSSKKLKENKSCGNNRPDQPVQMLDHNGIDFARFR
jgi:hypothetical protein